MKKLHLNIILGIEFTLLFFGVPLFLFLDKNLIHPSVLLLPILIAMIFYFRKQKDFHLRELFQLHISKKMWLKQGAVVLITGIILLGFVFIFEKENLFNLPKRNPAIWLAMLGFYPVFSAFGQEIVYRKFLFMRYKPLFQNKWILILASGISFSFVHIVYFSVLALVLTFFAGIYLAFVYDKTKSVLFSGILHGVMGFIIFTVGLGQHFWVDIMKWL